MDWRATVASDICFALLTPSGQPPAGCLAALGCSIFNSPDLPSAQERLKHLVFAYAKPAPRLSTWMEDNLPRGFTVFSLPPAHQGRLRTRNASERVHLELKRRTGVASLFPNTASLLRLISALLVEINDEWTTGKIYLNMKPSKPTPIENSFLQKNICASS